MILNFNEFVNESAFSNDPILNKFFAELQKSATLTYNPFTRMIVLGDIGEIEMSRFDKHSRPEVELKDIIVMDKGQGHGNEMMKLITDAADKLKYTVTLYAKPFGNSGLKIKPLVQFYKKHGFETVPDQYGETDVKTIEKYVFSEPGEGLEMIRKPK